MANPQNLKPWPSGTSGNKNGRPPIPPELREIEKINADTVARLISKHLQSTDKEIQRVIEDPTSKALDVLISSIILRAIQTGDPSRLEWLMARAIGKIREQVELKTMKPFIIHYGDGSKTILGSDVVPT